MGIEAFGLAIKYVKDAFDVAKNIKELLPDSAEKRSAIEALEQAEKNFKIAEAHAAKELGYPICKCTWPPQIMLQKKMYHFKCDLCSTEVDTKPLEIRSFKSEFRKSLDNY